MGNGEGEARRPANMILVFHDMQIGHCTRQFWLLLALSVMNLFSLHAQSHQTSGIFWRAKARRSLRFNCFRSVLACWAKSSRNSAKKKYTPVGASCVQTNFTAAATWHSLTAARMMTMRVEIQLESFNESPTAGLSAITHWITCFFILWRKYFVPKWKVCSNRTAAESCQDFYWRLEESVYTALHLHGRLQLSIKRSILMSSWKPNVRSRIDRRAPLGPNPPSQLQCSMAQSYQSTKNPRHAIGTYSLYKFHWCCLASTNPLPSYYLKRTREHCIYIYTYLKSKWKSNFPTHGAFQIKILHYLNMYGKAMKQKTPFQNQTIFNDMKDFAPKCVSIQVF